MNDVKNEILNSKITGGDTKQSSEIGYEERQLIRLHKFKNVKPMKT